MKFPFPFKSADLPTTSSAVSSWPWPICATNPRTLSFRSDYENATQFDIAKATPDVQESIPNSPQDYHESAVISGGVRSDRLFFDPGATSFILEEAKEHSVAMVAIDSRNPFVDFRVSMEEMVEALGLRDWDFLEALLEWYLRVNHESNHGYIVGAFVDLLIHLAIIDESNSSPSSSSSSSSPSSAVTKLSFTSPLSFSSNEDEIIACKEG